MYTYTREDNIKMFLKERGVRGNIDEIKLA
jgi:hypothetical protein